MSKLQEARTEARRLIRATRGDGERQDDFVRRQVRTLAIGGDGTDAGVARKIGVSKSTLSRYLSGERYSPRTAEGLVALGVDACSCGVIGCGECERGRP